MRWGLLSTAKINEQIIAGAAESDRATIVAVGSRDGAKAKAYAREHQIARAYGSYEALLDDPDVEAVYISLPNGLHHAWTMRALGAGKHVLCEKPYSRSVREVEEGFAEAKARGRVLMEAFMYRHHPQMRRVVEIVRGGAIGVIRAIHGVFTYTLQRELDVRLSPALDGGALMDVGCYCVSGARLIAGEPLRVVGEQVTGPTGIDMAFSGMMRHPGDVISQFEASFVAPSRQRLDVIGADGVLTMEAPWRADFGGGVTMTRGGEVEIVEVPRANAYRLELENMADAAAGKVPALLGRDDAVWQARTIDALYASAREGRVMVMSSRG